MDSDGSRPIRVALEPGFDHGRVGAWSVDVPGCFCWGRTRDEALSRVSSSLHRFLDRLEAHGEDVEALRPRGNEDVEVVEEIPPTWLDADENGERYERNSTFAADRHPVSEAALQTAISRTESARDDLLAVAARVHAHESSVGHLPVLEEDPVTIPEHGERRQRGVDNLLRHVAGAEIWFASRLDRQVRYDGPDAEDLDAYLAATHRWAVERIRQMHASDPTLSGVDGKGEEWTLAKVLRRVVYHAYDHLDELERRLDLAEGAAESLTLRREPPPLPALARLLSRTGFGSRASDPERFAQMVAGSTETWSLWEGAQLAAFARVLTDGAFQAYVMTVAVDPRWQGRGVGRRLMRSVIDGREHLSFALGARTGVEPFYASLGFAPAPWMMSRRRSG